MLKALSGFGLLAGATYPFRTLAVFRRTPRLLAFVALPILVNFVVGIILYVGLLFFGWESIQDLMIYLSNWINSLIANLPAWLGFLKYLATGIGLLLNVLLIVGLLLITGFLLVQFGVLLGAPWYGQLSEQLEKLRTGQIVIVEVGIVRDIGRSLLFELKKLVLAAGIGVLLLLLNVIVPGIGTIAATIGGITLAATLVCLDFLDSPLERRRLRFRDKLRIVFKSLPASAGFAFVCLGLISIPFLNLLTIPLCVSSGTLFFCDRILPKLALPPSQPQLDKS